MTDNQSAYREVIADLKSRRDAIDHLIGELEALVGGQGPLRGMTVVEAAKAVLRENGKPMSPAAITERIKAGGCEVSSANTVASILHRYAKENEDVFSPERGLWAIHSDTVQKEPTLGASALTQGLGSVLPQVTSVPMTGLTDVVTSVGSVLPQVTSVPMTGLTDVVTSVGSVLPQVTSVPMTGLTDVATSVGSGLPSDPTVPSRKTRKRRS